MNDNEEKKIKELALGRILKMASRPSQPGDVEEYERCRAIILDMSEPQSPGWAPNYARDRKLGAQGD
jgi:hypothetical protein